MTPDEPIDALTLCLIPEEVRCMTSALTLYAEEETDDDDPQLLLAYVMSEIASQKHVLDGGDR